MIGAISYERWSEAQRCEAEYWAREAQNPAKLMADIADGHHFTAGVLDIRVDTVRGLSVLDIAGGPYPLFVGWGVARHTILDPADYPEARGVRRVRCLAEDFEPEPFDEVWGYNVLQHVRDPSAVMATARRCARLRVRWFDVVETPIYPVHPHSIRADWLRYEMSREGFRVVRDIDGSRLVEGYRQKWVALVAERA